jgi:hypothetical protein
VGLRDRLHPRVAPQAVTDVRRIDIHWTGEGRPGIA